MSNNLIHDDLELLAVDKPAAYISVDSFAKLTLDRLLFTVQSLKDKDVVSGTGQLSAYLSDFSWIGTPKLQFVAPNKAINKDRELDIALGADIEAIVQISINGERKKKISTLQIKITDLRVRLSATDNMLILEGTDFNIKRHPIRHADSEKNLLDAGIDPLEAARVEGHLYYGVISSSIASSLCKRSEFLLSELFPAFNFGVGIKLAILAGGDAVGIIPTSTVLLEPSAQCSCYEAGDLKHTTTKTEKIVEPDPQPNDELGKVNLGGPIPDNKDPLRDFGPRYSSLLSGIAGLYIPTTFASAMLVRSMPAIKIVASDNGYIGFRAEASIGFEIPKITLDMAGGGFLIDIPLDISVSAYSDMDLSKGIRAPIGHAIISPDKSAKPANLKIGFYPSVDLNGTVRLKATLKEANMGSYIVIVVGVGTALAFIGVPAWIAFLIDVALASILANGLPIALKKTIGEYIANAEWKLIDGLPLANQMMTLYPTAPFHMKSNSILASIDFKG